MKVKTAMVAALEWSCRCAGAVRSLSPLAAIGITLVVVLGGAGVASAANGGNFILGHDNTETSTSYMGNSRGTPLKLSAPGGVAPLKVNNSIQVPDLNASEVGGLNASQLSNGGEGYNTAGTPLDGALTEVASTGALPAGTYYVTATARVLVVPNDVEAGCAIFDSLTGGSFAGGESDDSPAMITLPGGQQGGFATLAATIAVKVTKGTVLQWLCATDEPSATPDGSSAEAGITAFQVRSSSGAPPLTAGPRLPVRRLLAPHGR